MEASGRPDKILLMIDKYGLSRKVKTLIYEGLYKRGMIEGSPLALPETNKYNRKDIMSMKLDFMLPFIDYLGLRSQINQVINNMAALFYTESIEKSFHRMLCQPVTEYLIGSGNYTWEPISKLPDQGDYSETWEISRSDNGETYILKHINFERKYVKQTPDQFTNEVKIQIECAKYELCPKIIEAWLCEKGGTFIMEKLDKTLEDLFKMYRSQEALYVLAGIVMGMLTKLHKLRIYHGDIHPNNIMVKSYPMTNEEIRRTYLIPKHISITEYKFSDLDQIHIQRYKFYFIDMGKSNFTDDYAMEIADFSDLEDMFSKNIKTTYQNVAKMLQYFVSNAE